MLKTIDYKYIAAKFIRDLIVVFAASAAVQTEVPDLATLYTAATAALGIAVYRLIREFIPAEADEEYEE